MSLTNIIDSAKPIIDTLFAPESIQDVSEQLQSLNLQSLVSVQADDDISEYEREIKALQEKKKAIEKKKKEEQRQKQLREQLRRQQEANERQMAEWKKKNRSFYERRKDEILDDWHNPRDIVKNLGDDVEELEEDIQLSRDQIRQLNRNIRRQGLHRWIINLALVGIPSSILIISAIINNLYQNIWNNHWWANGNLYLLANTWYLIIQSIVSQPLLWEIPPVLKYMKTIRLFALFSAMVYNVIFLGGIWDFFYLVLKEEEQPLDILMSLIVFYNLEQNFEVVLINCMIILKEFTLPFMPALTAQALHSPQLEDELSLTDLENLAVLMANIANPLKLFQIIFMWFFGYDPKDWVIENKNDEEHYYAGKVYNEVKTRI